MRGATGKPIKDIPQDVIFQSTRPMRGATQESEGKALQTMNFNPRAPCGARPRPPTDPIRHQYFNPRAPCGARLTRYSSRLRATEFQSTRPMRGATAWMPLPEPPKEISIHAPHAGRDPNGTQNAALYIDFNPRAPCGARLNSADFSGHSTSFQSTRPMRGATIGTGYVVIIIGISIHAPHAGRDGHGGQHPAQDLDFNPRAPCGARRVPSGCWSLSHWDFNPRAPCGARRLIGRPQHIVDRISIHAPHAGRDDTVYKPPCASNPFQSTRPMRGATPAGTSINAIPGFQSTRPMRGATAKVYKITLHTFATKGNS